MDNESQVSHCQRKDLKNMVRERENTSKKGKGTLQDGIGTEGTV